MEEPKAAAEKAAKAEPAAGSTAAKAVTPGNFYVQLASVKDSSGAKPLNIKRCRRNIPDFPALISARSRPDLGAKGTFHRIQAGPMSGTLRRSVLISRLPAVLAWLLQNSRE